MNQVYGKKLVKDCRDNTYWFGDIRSPDPSEEAYFGFDVTDMIQVGGGSLEVNMPVSAVRIYSNITTIESAIVAAEVLGFYFRDCDHEYTENDTYPQMFPNA